MVRVPLVVCEGFAGGTPNIEKLIYFLSILMNVEYKVISIKLFINIKILRNNFDLLFCFLYCYDTMPFASTQHVNA